MQQKLFEEIRTIIPKYDSDEINIAHLQYQAPYTRAVLKELFRINPVSVGVGRTTNSDLVLSGYNVPKGVSLHSLGFFLFHNEYIICRRQLLLRISSLVAWRKTSCYPKNSFLNAGWKAQRNLAKTRSTRTWYYRLAMAWERALLVDSPNRICLFYWFGWGFLNRILLVVFSLIPLMLM